VADADAAGADAASGIGTIAGTCIASTSLGVVSLLARPTASQLAAVQPPPAAREVRVSRFTASDGSLTWLELELGLGLGD